MKKVYALAAVALFFSFSPWMKIQAEEENGPGHWEQKAGEFQEKRLEMMTQKLKLSTEQQATIKGILENQGKQMKELAEKRKALHEETENKIKAALSDQQKTEFSEMQENRHKKMEEKMQEHKKRWIEKK